MHEHAAFLRALARGMLRDHQEAEDVVQDAFAAALDKEPADRHGVRAWLAGVVRNLARGSLRARRRRVRRERVAARPQTTTPTDEVAERVEVQRRLAEAVSQLPEPGRTIVMRRFYEGQSAAAIAKRMNVTPKTVRVHLRNSLALLRGALEKAFRGRAWLVALWWIAGRPRTAGAAAFSGARALVAGALATAATLVLFLAVSGDEPPPPKHIVRSEVALPRAREHADEPEPAAPVPPPAPPRGAGDVEPPPAKAASRTKKPVVAGLDNTPLEDLPTWGLRVGWRDTVYASASGKNVFSARRRGRELAIDYVLSADGATVGGGVIHQLPMRVHVLDGEPAALLIERFNHMGYGRSLAFVDKTTRLLWTLSLAELFDEDTRKRFPDVDKQVLWLEAFWVDEPRRRVVLQSKRDHFLTVALDTGAVTRTDPSVLLPLISSGRAQDRIRALRAAGPRRIKGLQAAVRSVLADEAAPFAVRLHAAVAALYDGGPKPPVELFEKGLKQEETRALAAEHMARARGAESLAALLDRLRGEGRVAARKKLVATWGRGALPALVRVVANEKETPGMRVQAAYTGALIGQKASVPTELLEAGLLLKDKDEMLGRWSARRLIDQGEEGAAVLAGIVDDERAPFEPRRYAIESLGATRAKAGRDALYRAVGGSNSLFTRLALMSLHRVKPPDLGERLGLLLEAGCPFDRLIAEHLHQFPEKSAANALLAALERYAPAGPERDRWSRVYMFVAALEACTGKRLGDDPDAWRRAVRGP